MPQTRTCVMNEGEENKKCLRENRVLKVLTRPLKDM